MKRPSFHSLSKSQQAKFGNGIGPWWFPAWLREFITNNVSWFFEDASWRHHDFGYYIGHSEKLRAEYDWKFFRAMVADARSQNGKWPALKEGVATLISLIFYVSVRLFGWRSFHYAPQYRRYNTAKKADLRPSKGRVNGTSKPKKRRV